MSSVIKAELLGRRPVPNGYMQMWPEKHVGSGGAPHSDSPQEQARREAATIIATAEAAASRLREEAFMEGRDLGLRQGLEEGRAQGQKEGFQAGLDQAREALQAADTVLAAAERAKSEAFATATEEMVELALAMAEKLVQKEIACDEGYLPRLVRDALAQLSEPGPVTVRVGAAPSVGRVGAISELNTLGSDIQVIIDEALAPGDCVVENEGGLLDGRLSTRLESIRRALEGVAL